MPYSTSNLNFLLKIVNCWIGQLCAISKNSSLNFVKLWEVKISILVKVWFSELKTGLFRFESLYSMEKVSIWNGYLTTKIYSTTLHSLHYSPPNINRKLSSHVSQSRTVYIWDTVSFLHTIHFDCYEFAFPWTYAILGLAQIVTLMTFIGSR